MRYAITCVVLFVLLINPINALSALLKGDDLLKGCRHIISKYEKQPLSAREDEDATFWIGYIKGFIDGHYVQSVFNGGIYCLPEDDISMEQMARILEKGLKTNPEQLHLEARYLILSILTSTYPCPKTN